MRVFLLLLVLVPLTGVLYQWLGTLRDRRRYPPPGSLCGGLHIWRQGHAGPPVVLEAGVAATSLSWQRLQPRLAEFATVWSYDRAGLGWSAPARTPRSIGNLVDELHSLLIEARVPLPCTVVAHSFGGLLMRHYASRYPQDLAGLLLLDPLVPGEWWPITSTQRHRLSRGVFLSRWGGWLARFGVVRFALDLLMSGFRSVPKLIAKASSGKASGVTERLVGEVRKLPPEVWPAIRSHWCLAKSFAAMADYLDTIPDACCLPLDDTALRDVPLTIVSASTSPTPVIVEHRRWAALSRNGRHVVAADCGHWVQLDAPELIVELLREQASA